MESFERLHPTNELAEQWGGRKRPEKELYVEVVE